MLKRITGSGVDSECSTGILTEDQAELSSSVPVGRASFPMPFPRTLEYNAPVHGTWNIVHIGMAVPESHSIYVCSDNCMRGVVMTAAEMGCRDRFHCVTILEHDIQVDNLETITIEGVSDVIRHLPKQPPVVFVFLVCLHIFVGSDEDYIFRELGKRWPGIRFVKAYMDCVRQKEGPTPDMKLRLAEYEPIEPLPPQQGRVNILGCDVPYEKDSQLISLLTSRGCTVRQLQDCRTYEEFLSLGDAMVNVCTYPNAQEGIRRLSDRMNCSCLYLPPAVSYEEIRQQIGQLSDACGLDPVSEAWLTEEERLCEESLHHLAEALKEKRVAVDYTAHQRPLGITRLLITHGINVKCVYLDAILEEEREAFEWLKVNVPALPLISTILPPMVHLGRDQIADDGNVIAFGQKAAWYEQTGHFVNMIEGGGLWGYQGIREICSLLEDAARTELDRMQIIPRKGMGWPSMCTVQAQK